LVKIKHPSKVLSDGLVIIDTPGTNAVNERHELVTAKVIKEIADAAIIAIPSNVPLSNSLLSFVRENLTDVISKCVFVVTKMDLIRMKEQQRVLSYVEQKLKTEFSIDEINIFPYTPLLMLKDVVSDVDFNLSGDYIAFLSNQSKQAEIQIIEILKQQRLIIQMQKLIILMKKLFDTLEQDLRIFEKKYKDRHDALEKNKIKDLGSFIKNRKEIHKQGIIDGSREIRKKLSYLLEKTQEDLLKNLNDDIFGAQNHNELNSIMEKKIGLTISLKQDELKKSLPDVFNGFQLLAQKQNAEFEREFNKLYTNLSTLGGKISVNEHALSYKTSDLVGNYAKEQIASVNETVKSENNRVTFASAGGVGAGALIGTAIFPGVGTVVGALVGSLTGLIFRKPLNELKSKYYSSAKESIDDSFRKAKDSSQVIADDIVNGLVKDLFAIIDSYFSQYDLLVKEMIKRDEYEKKELERKSEIINRDLYELSKRRNILDGLRKKL